MTHDSDDSDDSDDNRTAHDYDVAVIGFGPSGAVAAALLAGYGLSVFVCDRNTNVYDKPRAFALDHEIMRVFQQLGLAEQVLAFTERFTPSEFYGADGQLIKRFTNADPPYPFAFNPALVFHQPQVERVLRQHVAGLPQVHVALGQSLVALTQDRDSVALTVQAPQVNDSAPSDSVPNDSVPNDSVPNFSVPLRQIRAKYVIGCDGATSTVRQLTGIRLDDLGFDQPWLVVDVLVNRQGLRKLPTVSMQICEPRRPTTFLIGTNSHRRWEIAINDDEDPAALVTPEQTWKLLSRWITPQDGELWRQASYRFHALVANQWRNGRIFVAGDAAHQQPPFLGQGMCQGIRDVANLAWKLQAVLRHNVDQQLLDSYGSERKAHVTELTTRIKAIGQLVAQRDPAKARQRDAELLAACGGTVVSQARQSVQPALADGFLSSVQHPAVGTLFPQAWVQQGTDRQRMDELTGCGWRVFVNTATTDEFAQLAATLAATINAPFRTWQLGAAPLLECEGVLAAWFEQHDCLAAIVRPDHYVYGIAQSCGELLTELAQCRQRLCDGAIE